MSGATTPGRRSVAECVLIAALGAVLAWAGAVEGVDSIVHYVFAVVDPIAADPISLLQPVFVHEPMDYRVYRPLSIALVKLGSAVFGRSDAGLQAFTFAHGLALIPFGLAARHFLCAVGLSTRLATAAAVTSMLTPSMLFSAWTIPEFDLVGGVFILVAAAALLQRRWWLFWPCAVLALLTKETTAVLMLVFLVALAFTTRHESWRAARATAAYLALMALAFVPLFAADFDGPVEDNPFFFGSQVFAWSNVPHLAFHTASQLLYLVGPPGALLIGWAATAPSWSAARAASAAALLLWPPLLAHYNHYEAITFSHWPWVLLWVLVAAAGLAALVWRCESSLRPLALIVTLAFCGVFGGTVLGSSGRSDISARLFAPIVPLLCALALAGAWRALQAAPRAGRLIAAVALACFLWAPAAGAFNAWQATHARFPTELDAKRDLVAALAPPCPWIFYPNRDQELAIEELDALGEVPPAVRDCAKVIQLQRFALGPNSFWRYDGRLRGWDQRRERIIADDIEGALRERRPLPRPVHVFVLGVRSAMPAAANAALTRDFSWADGRIPESEQFDIDRTTRVVFSGGTPLERYFAAAATDQSRRASPYPQLPLWLHEIPRRLLTGVPLLERYHYVADRYSLPAGGVAAIEPNDPRTRAPTPAAP